MGDEALHDLTAAYALDALDEHDARAYEEHLTRCERCRAELAELSSAATALASATPAVPPPPALRGRILDAARAERPNVAPLRPRWAVPAAVAAVVATAAAVALGVWSATLLGRVHARENALGRMRDAAAVLADPSARRIPLHGAQGSLVVGPTGEAALVLARLDRAAGGRAYEAWVVEDGKPHAAALFRGGARPTLVRLTHVVPKGALVAVTEEPAGGSRQPTGPRLFGAPA